MSKDSTSVSLTWRQRDSGDAAPVQTSLDCRFSLVSSIPALGSRRCCQEDKQLWQTPCLLPAEHRAAAGERNMAPSESWCYSWSTGANMWGENTMQHDAARTGTRFVYSWQISRFMSVMTRSFISYITAQSTNETLLEHERQVEIRVFRTYSEWCQEAHRDLIGRHWWASPPSGTPRLTCSSRSQQPPRAILLPDCSCSPVQTDTQLVCLSLCLVSSSCPGQTSAAGSLPPGPDYDRWSPGDNTTGGS